MLKERQQCLLMATNQLNLMALTCTSRKFGNFIKSQMNL